MTHDSLGDSCEPSEEYKALSKRIHLLETQMMEGLTEAAESRKFQLGQMGQQVGEVKRALEIQTNMTAELLELLDSAKHAVKFIVLAGKVAIWLAKVGGAVVAIWLAAKGIGLAILGRHP